MGERITFRGRGCAVSDGGMPMPAVSITEPRVKFIKGWLTGETDPEDGSVECGAGTRYPVMAKVDQISEIYYRVRDSRIQAGETLSANGEGSADSEVKLFVSAQAPPVNNDHVGGDTICKRAYWIDGANATDKRQIWGNLSTVSPTGTVDTPSSFSPEHQCGMRHFLSSENESEDNGADYHLYDGSSSSFGSPEVSLRFNGLVAFIDKDGSGHPFSAGNDLWMGVVAYADWADGSGNLLYDASTFLEYVSLGGAPNTLIDGCVLKLQSGDLKCNLYGGTFAESLTGSLTFVATKWWPYKTSSGEPAWDELTGEPINGGPAA